MQINPVTFLLVEDDDIDFWAMERALKTLKISNPLIRATDALEALDLLSEKKANQGFVESVIILLDLNLPCINGFEFLTRLENDPHYNDVPVIITTTSDANADLKRAGQRKIAGYVLKSDLTEGLRESLDNLNIYSQITLNPDRMNSTLSPPSPNSHIPEMATA